jgi:putative endonuclease
MSFNAFRGLMKIPCVYILTNKPNGTLYVGVTSDPLKRMWQHREGFVSGFTHRHELHRLVWYELHENMEAAIYREKVIKKWKRDWKKRLIEDMNPEWKDLYGGLI